MDMEQHAEHRHPLPFSTPSAGRPGRRLARWAGGLALLLAGAAAAASPGMMVSPMGMMGMKEGMKAHGYGHGHHALAPHNAAAHFLMMAGRLGLDEQQRRRLRELRDRWIEEHAADEARLRAARQDLQAVLRADTIDRAKAEELLGRIGQLEQGLWRAFIEQLATIKEMLTPEQRQRLRMMHRMMKGHGMGMPMGGGMRGEMSGHPKAHGMSR